MEVYKFHPYSPVLYFQYVCMGGSTDRMKQFAEFIQSELRDYLKEKDQKEPPNLAKSDRYVLYKVGPVLSANVCHLFLV